MSRFIKTLLETRSAFAFFAASVLYILSFIDIYIFLSFTHVASIYANLLEQKKAFS